MAIMRARWQNSCMSARQRSERYSVGACQQGECRNYSRNCVRQACPCKLAIIDAAGSGWLLSRCCRTMCAHYRTMCAQQGGCYLTMCARDRRCCRAEPWSLSSRYSYIHLSPGSHLEEVPVEPVAEFAQLPLRFGDHVQWRYELIRPLVLFDDRTATQRPQKTHTHPNTVRTFP